MKYSKVNGIHIAEVPAKDFKILMVDAPKKAAIGGNGCNAGFFGNYSEGGAKFTLPVGPLVCDVATSSKWTLEYCQQRGTLSVGKLRYPCGSWDKRFYGKAVSALIIANGKAEIRELSALPPCDYAIMGVPVIRDGKAVSFTQAKAQGRDGSTLYGTWHVFAGVKGDGKVYAMGAKTTSGNLLNGEGWRLFGGMGFTDLIKVDGGGSFIFKAAGKTKHTLENRRINTIFTFGGNPWPVPTRTLKKGSWGNDVKWLQWELADRGFPCTVDGSFGPGTKAALKACQKALGLVQDGSCGPATRAALQK